MMKSQTTAIILALLLGGCVTEATEPTSTQTSAPVATQADVPIAHAALKTVLKDPDSVRFLGDIFRPGVVCGTFNAKNSFGGYGDPTLYLYVVNTHEVQVAPEHFDSTDDRVAWARFKRFCPD